MKPMCAPSSVIARGTNLAVRPGANLAVDWCKTGAPWCKSGGRSYLEVCLESFDFSEGNDL
jgi:hypothetical protein